MNDKVQILDLAKILHENVRWSNILIESPIDFSLLERRVMYLVTREVKRHCTEMNLTNRVNWEGVRFMLNDNDLELIGGKKNIPRTCEALDALARKFFTICSLVSG